MNEDSIKLTQANIVNKLWGRELIFINWGAYCCKRLELAHPNVWSSVHFHKGKTETFVNFKGFPILQVWYSISSFISRGEYNPDLLFLDIMSDFSLTIGPFTPHRFCSRTNNTSFTETSTTDRDNDSFRLTSSRKFLAKDFEYVQNINNS